MISLFLKYKIIPQLLDFIRWNHIYQFEVNNIGFQYIFINLNGISYKKKIY